MKIQSTCLICFNLIFFFLSINASAQTEEGWQASKQVVEKLSKERSEFNYVEEKVPAYKLPDLFISVDRTKINTPDLWNNFRRPEIIELFRKNVYGRVPVTPYEKSFKVVKLEKNAMDGSAT